jgi:hypothetical protein
MANDSSPVFAPTSVGVSLGGFASQPIMQFGGYAPSSALGPLVVDLHEYAQNLKSALKAFHAPKEKFEIGQLVKWKANLKTALRPGYGEPAIVVSVLDEPIVDDRHDAGSPYYRQTLDIVLGVLGAERELLMFHFDSRRFERFGQ